MSEPSAELELSGVRRRFGRLSVLEGVDGRVGSGEVLLVTGSNGSGKSTLLRCICGLLRPDAGRIAYREDGATVDPSERRRRLGWVAPDLELYAELTVAENLAFAARLRRLPRRTGCALAEQLGLPLDRAAGALSSGMRQRLRWVWALQHRPRLLLLDEPFQNLDAAGTAALTELLCGHLEDGLAVVASPTPIDLPRVKDHVRLAG